MMDAISWLDAHRMDLQRSLAERACASSAEVPHDDPLGIVEALTEAVRSGRQSLFHDYIAWAKIVRAQHDLEPRKLRETLELLVELLEEHTETHAFGLLPPISEILARFDELPTAIDSHIVPATNPHATLAGQYLDRLLEGRRREAIGLVTEAVEAGMTIREVYLDVFQPVQLEIGRLWQMNEATVAQEHLCTATTQLLMSRLYPRLFSGASCGHRIVTACVSQDLHEVGARFLADFFEMEGWDTTYLGANASPGRMADVARDEAADVVALSATLVHHVERVREAIAILRQDVPKVIIMVGGYPFIASPGLWRDIGADGTARDAETAVEVASRLVTR